MSTRIKRVEAVLKRHGLTVNTSKDYIEAGGYDRLDDKVWIRVDLHYDDQRERLALDSVYAAEETVDNALPPLGSFKHKTDDYRHTPYVRNLVGRIRREIAKACGAPLPYSGQPRHRSGHSFTRLGASLHQYVHRLSLR